MGSTESADLRLVPLTADSIQSLGAEPDAPLTQPALLGLVWPEDDRRVLRYRAQALAADPSAGRWLLAAALDEQGSVVGRIGCHSAPVNGRVEVGYWVRPDARGRGLATRLLSAYTEWLRAEGVRTVVLTVGPDNAASLRIACRAGFVRTGEQWDEEDGRELVLERTLPAGGLRCGADAGTDAPARPVDDPSLAR